MEPVYSLAPHAFYKINYSEPIPRLISSDLSSSPIPIMNAVRYRGENGQRSSCRGAQSCDTDTWRENYPEAFETGATCKTLSGRMSRNTGFSFRPKS